MVIYRSGQDLNLTEQAVIGRGVYRAVSPHFKGLTNAYKGHLVTCSLSSLAVSELLEQTGYPGAREPLTDVHSSVQPKGGSHHTPAQGQDAPAPEVSIVSATRPPAHPG